MDFKHFAQKGKKQLVSRFIVNWKFRKKGIKRQTSGVMDRRQGSIRSETFHRDEEVENRDTRSVRDSIHLHGNCRPGERYLPTVTRTRGLRTSPVFYIARDRTLLTYMSSCKHASIEHENLENYGNLENLFHSSSISLGEKKLIHRRSIRDI